MIDLQISRVLGKIGLEINNARYDLNISKPDLKIEQVPADIVLERTDPDIQIDYSPKLEALGYGGIEFMNRRYAQEAISKYMNNLEKSVHIGYSLGAIEKGLSVGEVISRAAEPEEPEIGLVPIPDIRVIPQPGTLTYRAQIGGANVDIDLEQLKVSIQNFAFPSVEVYMEQEPELRISAIGQIVDLKK